MMVLEMVSTLFLRFFRELGKRRGCTRVIRTRHVKRRGRIVRVEGKRRHF